MSNKHAVTSDPASFYKRGAPVVLVLVAIALLPLFLIWLNFSWWIFLFGAELAHTAANLQRIQSAERSEHIMLGPADLLAATVAVAQSYQGGGGPVNITPAASAGTMIWSKTGMATSRTPARER